MIWYVATLIASVISTRGLAAQGELKCSVPPPSLLAFSDLPLRDLALEPRGRASGSVQAHLGALARGPGS